MDFATSYGTPFDRVQHNISHNQKFQIWTAQRHGTMAQTRSTGKLQLSERLGRGGGSSPLPRPRRSTGAVWQTALPGRIKPRGLGALHSDGPGKAFLRPAGAQRLPPACGMLVNYERRRNEASERGIRGSLELRRSPGVLKRGGKAFVAPT